MKLFKSKEERILIKSQNLINEVNELNLKYKNELKAYCMIKIHQKGVSNKFLIICHF